MIKKNPVLPVNVLLIVAFFLQVVKVLKYWHFIIKQVKKSPLRQDQESRAFV